MLTLIITSTVLGIFLIVIFFASLYAYKSAFYAKGSKAHVSGYFEKSGSLTAVEEKIQSLTKALLDETYEDVWIKSYDGLDLHARFYKMKEGAPVQIFMHGYKGNPFRSMSGLFKIAKSIQHNVLIVDQRGCGQSSGKAITFGVKERLDAVSWTNYITVRFGNVPIFLVGISLGGASVLMANNGTLPKEVVGVIADCPFSSPVGILKKVCADHGIPRIFFPFIISGAFLFGHFNPYSGSAAKAVRNASVPIVILHGEDDGFVPIAMAEEIYENCRCEKYMYRFKGADHAICYMVDSDAYEKATVDFIEKCLKQ